MPIVVPGMIHAVAFAALFVLQCAAAAAAPSVDLNTASGGMWRDVEQRKIVAGGERVTVPNRYRLVALDAAVFNATMALAPMEFSPAARQVALVVTLPLPDGGTGRFQVQKTQLMAPGLAAKFPEIRTWTGQGIDDPAATARLDWTPQGFHAMVLSPSSGQVFIDPYSRDDTIHYMSYHTRDQAPPDRSGVKMVPPVDPDPALTAQLQRAPGLKAGASSGTQLRTYRLAVAATKEYTNFHGGTVPLGQAAIVTAVNRVVGIYEVEVAIRMQLVANNDRLVYTTANPGPYTNDNVGLLLTENQANVDAVIGSAHYDIGHVFSTFGGGQAELRSPCIAGKKAKGAAGSATPSGDTFWVGIVAHEMGHQFGANHTFNSRRGPVCSINSRNPATAYEPGSGSTIMSYAGLCGEDDVQQHTDPYFHTASFDEIVAFTTTGAGNSCAAITPTNNNPPVVTMPVGSFNIPASTPFALTGAATDADGDALTYSWEEYDLGPAGPPGVSTSAPFFRSWNPTTSPMRTFPAPGNLLAGTPASGEVLPSDSRALIFRMTVRDNRGGVAYGTLAFNVWSDIGPFAVTVPNTNVTWAPLSTQTVKWKGRNTQSICTSVDILLSTDGGRTFPTVLLAGEENFFSASVTLPNVHTTQARIKVACTDNVFFAISPVDFTIGVNPGPVVATKAATSVGQTGATLNGTVSGNGSVTAVTFNYGTTPGYGASVTAAQSPLAGDSANAPVSAVVTGLTCATLHHFQAMGVNGLGATSGGDLTFTTAACPVTTTLLASNNNPSSVGAPVAFTAAVTGIAPTGTIAFKDGGVVITGCGAVAISGTGNTRIATCVTTSLALGTHTITAAYSGDAGNKSSTSTDLTQNVRRALRFPSSPIRPAGLQ